MIQFSNSMQKLLNEIEVSDSNYEKATRRYEAIAAFISESTLKQYEPDVFIQGSFKLGTAIKPLTDEGSYDIDLVLVLKSLRKKDISQVELKRITGESIEQYVKVNEMKNEAEDGKRCWTVTYVDEDNFHLDILPVLPDAFVEDGYDYVVALTDKRSENYHYISENWQISNPQGYYNWFYELSKFSQYKIKFARSINAQVEKVPNYRVKTPLQRCVQVLKRHAEIMFQDNAEYKPSSIIITTLAAKAYTSIVDTGLNFTQLMVMVIRKLEVCADREGNRLCVYNPVNRNESFTIKWDADEQYQEEFLRWLRQLEFDFSTKNRRFNVNEQFGLIKRSLDKNIMQLKSKNSLDFLPYHQQPCWEMKLWKDVAIQATVHKAGFRPYSLKSGEHINTGVRIEFKVKSTNLGLYSIYWQVTNTGAEADDANQLRGDFYDSDLKAGKDTRVETTSYVGTHYVEVYLVDSEHHCVGKSEPFVVEIRKMNLFQFRKR